MANGELDLGKLADAAEKKAQEEDAGEFKDLTGKDRQALGDKVKEVRVTLPAHRFAACLVSDQHDISANLERLLKAAGQKRTAAKPILEINPAHPLVRQPQEGAGRRNGAVRRVVGACIVRSGTAGRGRALEDPAGFVKRLNRADAGPGREGLTLFYR